MRKLLLTVALLALPRIVLGQGGTPAGAYNTGAGGSSSSTSSPGRSIDPTSATYGAKFDVSTAPDISTTSGSNIVTCPNSDCKFITGTFPAKVGMVFFANIGTGSSCLDNPDLLFGGLRETTIASIAGDNSITVVGNAGSTTVAVACGFWGAAGGVDDTAALNAAWAAGGCTSSQLLPVGKAFFSAPIWQLIAGCPSVANAGTGYQAPRIWGSSVTGTYLIPRPSFNFASVTGGGGVNCVPASCTGAVGNPNISDYENFEVWGGGERCSATLASTTLWLIGLSTRFINTAGVGWCARGGGATLIGTNITASEDIYNYAGTNFFGSIQINLTSSATLVFLGNSAISGNNFTISGGCGVQLQGGSSAFSTGNGFAVCLSTGGGAGATLNSVNSTWSSNGGDSCILPGTNGVINLLGNDVICLPTVGNAAGIALGVSGATGAVVSASNSNIGGSGTGNSVQGAAGNTFIDVINNKFPVGGGAVKWNGLGNFFGDGSLTTGAAPTISSGFGTSPAILKNSGTASFTVNVGTGGVATAGIIGLPTANAGWTCQVYNQTAHAGHRADDTVQTANTVSTVTVESQTKSTGAAVAWTASDTLNMECRAN